MGTFTVEGCCGNESAAAASMNDSSDVVEGFQANKLQLLQEQQSTMRKENEEHCAFQRL